MSSMSKKRVFNIFGGLLMKVIYPSVFSFEDETVKLIYLKGSDVPFYSATTVAKALKLKAPSVSSLAAVTTLCEKVKTYCSLTGKEFVTGLPVEIANSVRKAEIVASDGVITVVRVFSSNKITNSKFSYYYNQEGLYEVLLNSNAEGALRFRYWVTHEVVPAIAKHGEYVAARKDGIGIRRFLTDAIKRQIDLKRMDEHAYPTITDVVYIIRYGMNSNQLRRHLGLEEGDNIREHLSQEELQALARIEDELAGLLNFGLKPEQVMTNKEFLSVHRKPL